MKVYVIGFTPQEVEELKKILGMEVLCIPEYCRDWVLASIVSQEKLEGRSDWHFRKFIIIHGATNEEIKKILGAVKRKFKNVIFATTTPTSLTWRLEDLLNELIREDEYFKNLRMRRGPYLEL
ncbi:hypothetical protein A3L04_04320 [Thermococcus chitonophagus]|uniref:DUF3783 domain-containing protein n=1 Tax=Thermococcus chitonophagus TaxID=54262 RepID=A0A170ST81_9EURY|nr:DUF3783 domain-containing protein [Thermococcus chitonophagus]ASJ16353.1 hypothetical protein A3L04_04320 [Thermococcus chitonophagus]CUX78654.1 hypothetical protein CHITON_1875 [Thermococcus chitonophagus]